MSQLRELAEEECELTMTPMIDVTFLLLIFFMCTIRFKTLEGKLSAHLPKDVGFQSEPLGPVEKVDIKLTVISEGSKMHPARWGEPWSGKGPFRYGDDRVIRYAIGPFSSPSCKSPPPSLAASAASPASLAVAAASELASSMTASPSTGEIVPELSLPESPF